ncbi:hypothetical protein [Paenibacillus sp. LPE1-1-1.1]|uniref:hypothetical protein n=1 Tax=Paenibacillus sp. LPE1-1-1.1 TaxID=3135230 RepID=UPI003442E68E
MKIKKSITQHPNDTFEGTLHVTDCDGTTAEIKCGCDHESMEDAIEHLDEIEFDLNRFDTLAEYDLWMIEEG